MNLESINVKIEGGLDLEFPKMVEVTQHFDAEKLENIKETVFEDMETKLTSKWYQNKKIAVGVGSRGIANLSIVVKSVIDKLKEWKADPFIVPAMGSHGGATAEGQKEVLEGYGITEEKMGVSIVSSMNVAQIATSETGMPIYLDQNAYHSDGIVVINRVKVHTDFKGDYESGLLKMLAIGLGKHKGATTLHTYGFDQFHELIPRTGEAIIKNAPVMFGIAIVENAFEETSRVEVVPQDQLLDREKELMKESRSNMPGLNLSSIDCLIIDEIGKNISGSGMDPNITGRPGSRLPGFSAPPIQKIVVLGLTEQTHGNATGLGMADVTTIPCINQIEFNAFYANTITSTVLEGAKIPLAMNNDKEAIAVALKTCNRIVPSQARIVRIKNTLELKDIQVSEAYLEEIKEREDLTVLSEPKPIKFTDEGKLI